jgi:hypothetical protein
LNADHDVRVGRKNTLRIWAINVDIDEKSDAEFGKKISGYKRLARREMLSSAVQVIPRSSNVQYLGGVTQITLPLISISKVHSINL